MMRIILLTFLCLCTLAPAAAQQSSDLEYFSMNNVVPIARLGFGVPYALEAMPTSEAFVVATGAGVTIYEFQPRGSGFWLEELFHINTGNHAPTVIAISPDGRLLATGSDDVRLWDLQTGTLLEIMMTGRGVAGLAFSADGERLAATKGWGSRGGRHGIVIFDTASGRELAHLMPDRIFSAVEFLPDGDRLVAQRVYDCCGNGVVINLDTGEMQDILSDAYAFQLTPNGDQVIAYSGGIGWHRFDLTAEGLPEVAHADYDSTLYWLEMSAINDESKFAALTPEGELTIWDVETLTQQENFTLGFEAKLAAFSADGTFAVVLNLDDLFFRVDTQTGEVVEGRSFPHVEVSPITFIGDYLIYTTDSEIMLWDIWGARDSSFRGHDGRINALVVDHEHQLLYSSSSDGTVRRWNLGSSEGTTLFEQPGTQINALALGTEDNLYAVICENNSGRLVRLDAINGGSLGFYLDASAAEPTVSSLEMPACNVELIPSIYGDFGYADFRYLYRSDGLHTNPTTRYEIPMSYSQIRAHEDGILLIDRGVAVVWEPLQIDYHAIQSVASHQNDITALAQIDTYLYALSACAGYGYYGDGEPYCYGANMMVFGFGIYGERAPLAGHSGIVRQIVRHPSLPLFASISEDGTIILWGSPREPQPMRRIGQGPTLG
jgi:WD40 repeat protein